MRREDREGDGKKEEECEEGAMECEEGMNGAQGVLEKEDGC